MNQGQFDTIVDNRLKNSKLVLIDKAIQYASNEDRLHNFHVAARIDNITPEQALWGMYKKHLVSVIDIKNDPNRFSLDVIQEKIQDSINYMILLEALLIERIEITLENEN